MVVLGITFGATFMSLNSLSDQEAFARDHLTAKRILASYYEEIRGQSLNDVTFFDGIDLQFPAPGVWVSYDAPGYPAGFFQRRMVYVDGTTEIKRFSLAVQWTEKGKTRQIINVFSLARPPYQLNGNIDGTVTDCNTSLPIEGVAVQIYQGGGQVQGTIVDTDMSGYYSFDSNSGFFFLPPGDDYLLQFVHNDYMNKISDLITVVPDQTESYDVCLDQSVEREIIGKVVDLDGNAIVGQYVSLYQDGEFLESAENTADGFTLTATLQLPVEYFTVITSDQLKISSFPFLKTKADGFCGYLCPARNDGVWLGNSLEYSYRGWSSSVVRSNNITGSGQYTNTECSYPWQGSSATDRVELSVDFTEQKDLGNIILVPVPKITELKGKVTKVEGGNTVNFQGATVGWKWVFESNTSYSSYEPLNITDANGDYTFLSVPAVQDLFPNSSNYQIYIQATPVGYFHSAACCGLGSQVSSKTFTKRPLQSGQTYTQNFDFVATTSVNCGDVYGTITDFSGSPIEGAAVNMGSTEQTDPNGDYAFVCPAGEPPFKLNSGSKSWYVNKTNFYIRYRSAVFPYLESGYVNVPVSGEVEFNTALLPKGNGTISVTVVDSVTNDPIEEAEVEYYQYSEGSEPTSDGLTNDEGIFSFFNVVESWPKEEWKPGATYNVPDGLQTQIRRHKIKVSKDIYNDYELGGIIVEDGQSLNIIVELVSTEGQGA